MIGRRLRLLSTRFNGRPVRVRRGWDGVLRARLSAAGSLRPGVNVLRVEAKNPGARLPVNATSQFTVTYPSRKLLAVWVVSRPGGVSVLPRLRVPTRGLSALSVRLNGQNVSSSLRRPTADGRRRLELSAAAHLRWGSNTLTVTAVMYDGRAQTASRSFHLDQRRNIAGIRLLTSAHVGHRVRLDASLSRPVAGSLRGSSVRWMLIRRPAKSRVAIPSRGTPIAWTPDVPGDYIVRVRVGSRARAGAATLTVSATYPSPLVPLNSIDAGNPSALTIASTPYAVDGALKVNVLDRATLEWISGQGFDATSAGIASMGSYLKALPDTDLVFVSHPSASPAVNFSDLAALNNALGYIGGSYPSLWWLNLPGCWAGATNNCYQNSTGWYRPSGQSAIGSFSVAGVPGMSVGQAWRATAVQSRSTEGRITGYLSHGVPAQTGGVQSYVIDAGADQYVQVDTCASGGPTQCVIRVGSQTFAPTPGANGFNVVTLDRTTLTPIAHVTATSAGQLLSTLAPVLTLGVGRQLPPPQFIDDQRIVIVQSVGTGILPPSTSDPYPALDQFGATPELFKAASSTGSPYGMVGVANHLPWHGTATESSPLVSTQQTGRLRTILSRDRDWRLTPSAGDPYGQTNLDLYTTIYQNPTPWPYEGDPAIGYIATALGLLPDVRSQYTNTNVVFSTKATSLSNLTCTDTAACGPNFDLVKAQLLKEFDWVETVRALISNLEYPFVLVGETQPVNVKTVYDDVAATIHPPGSQNTRFSFLGMFLDITNLAAAVASQAGFDDAGVPLGLIAAGGQFAADSISQPDGESTDTLAGTVDQLDEQFAYQEQATVEALDQLGAILVSEAGKLQTVGTKVGTDPAWAWTQGSSLSEAITALNATSRAQSYSALLPPTWAMWNLKPDNVTQTTSDDVKTYKCIGSFTPPGFDPLVAPWADTPEANQLHAVTSVTSQQAVVSQVWTFSNIDVGNGPYQFSYQPAYAVTVPAQSLTDNLTSTNTNTGAFQYLPQWIRTTYNPPGHVVCSTAPNNTTTVAKPPPTIPNGQAAQNQ